MRRRLRPMPSESELAKMYPSPHDHLLYGRGHSERVEATIQVALRLVRWWTPDEVLTLGDLSCGNGAVVKAVAERKPDITIRGHLGDFAPGWDLQGPIEKTIAEIPDV